LVAGRQAATAAEVVHAGGMHIITTPTEVYILLLTTNMVKKKD
jgi:hypothetical protein